MSARGRRVARRRRTVREGSMMMVGGGVGLLWRLASLGESKIASVGGMGMCEFVV